MIVLKFRQWLELFGQPVDLAEPVQDPNKLNNGAMPRYEIPDPPDPLLGPPVRKSKKRMKKDGQSSSSSS
jgi:hypothetical protein